MKEVNRIRYGSNIAVVYNQAGMYRIEINKEITSQFFATKKAAEDESYDRACKWLFG